MQKKRLPERSSLRTRILKLYKGKEEDHVEWCKALNGFFQGLEPYVKQHHTTGLSWGTGGGAAKPAAAGAGSSSSGAGSVEDFKAIVAEFITPYLELSQKIGGPVNEQAQLVQKAVKLETDLIAKAGGQKKPADAELQKLLGPISELMVKVAEIKEKNRGHQNWNHLSTVSEGIQILGWVAVEPKPGPFAKDAIGGSEFWSNKILKDFKGKDESQVNWVKGFNGFLKAIPPYIAQYHTTGLAWSK